MSLTRKLMLLVGMVLAAIAFSAVPAAAQEAPVELTNEHTGAPCNPCTFHAEGESHIRNLASGNLIATCHDEFEGIFLDDGTGELEWVGTTHTAVSCWSPCSTAAERHWPVSNTGEIDADTGHMTLRLCIDAGFGDSHCNAEVQVQETPSGSHQHVLSTSQLCSGGFTRFEGAWEQETINHDEIAATHL